MNKELFDKFLNKEIVINCKTAEEEIEFLEYCHNQGLVWSNNNSLLECRQWGIYREDTCYSVYTENELCYGEREYYTKEYKKKIVLYKDLIKQDKQEFSKKDLRTGHIVKFRNGETAMLVGDTFFGSMDILDGDFNHGQLNQYDEYLKDIEYGYDTDIMEVYYIKSTEYDLGVKGMIENIPEEHAELIWKREEEIDWWNKVPMWTRVLVRNDNKEDWTKAYFLYESNNDDYPYCVTICDRFTYNEVFDKCYLQIKPFDEKDIKEEWYK